MALLILMCQTHFPIHSLFDVCSGIDAGKHFKAVTCLDRIAIANSVIPDVCQELIGSQFQLVSDIAIHVTFGVCECLDDLGICLSIVCDLGCTTICLPDHHFGFLLRNYHVGSLHHHLCLYGIFGLRDVLPHCGCVQYGRGERIRQRFTIELECVDAGVQACPEMFIHSRLHVACNLDLVVEENRSIVVACLLRDDMNRMELEQFEVILGLIFKFLVQLDNFLWEELVLQGDSDNNWQAIQSSTIKEVFMPLIKCQGLDRLGVRDKRFPWPPDVKTWIRERFVFNRFPDPIVFDGHLCW
mmetsp:Transcript_12559/g.22136  ORF Transcript_12559/g.22136 Transcript_12559/m.22136 type:complete len:299 (+) Transcript_12559:62-958(+)